MSNKIIFIAFLFGFTLSMTAQNTNPDGNTVSLHITPYLTNGSSDVATDYNFAGSISEIETIDYDQTFNFNIMLKIPLTNRITVSPIFEYVKLKNGELVRLLTRAGARFSFYFD